MHGLKTIKMYDTNKFSVVVHVYSADLPYSKRMCSLVSSH